MWLSRVRVPDASAQPHTSRMRSSRDRTLPGLLHERDEQVELEGRQMNRPAVDRDATSGPIEEQAVDGDGRLSLRRQLAALARPA